MFFFLLLPIAVSSKQAEAAAPGQTVVLLGGQSERAQDRAIRSIWSHVIVPVGCLFEPGRGRGSVNLTFEALFSALSKSMLGSKGSVCSIIFQNLQDRHDFAPL